jgi:exodeoxyribonuclease VII large subunit
MNILTVSQLNRYVRSVLEEDRKLTGLFVKGEIVNYTRNYRSGHVYFTLRDAGGAVRAVMFKTEAEGLRFEPEDGMAALVQARVGVYERDGTYQLYVTDIQPDGVGAQALAFEQLKRKLAMEGLFDERHKKAIPAFPGRIGVVTSETGAALQDIIKVIGRHNPLCTLVFAPAQVQGAGAAASLIAALGALDEHGDCGVIILGRGGGSAEDLSAFNDEALCRAVFACKTPVISAVGHETDYSLCDLAADFRAATPSAAAVQATLPLEEQRGRLAAAKAALKSSAAEMLRQSQQRLDFFAESLYNIKRREFAHLTDAISRRAALLENLSPLKVLARGYCITYRDDKAVLDADALKAGDLVTIKYRNGLAGAEITEVRP